MHHHHHYRYHHHRDLPFSRCRMVPLVAVVLGVVLLAAEPGLAAYRPNIVVILADDMGWNDVSFHGSDEIPTPNIDALAFNGVILNQHYVQPVCTPSRVALMSGRYPMHLGMQGPPILGAEPRGLPLGARLLPEYLQALGYVTRGIGKWHLGYHRTEYLPTRRGFDSWLGYYNGAVSYYDYILETTVPDYGYMAGFDLYRNESLAWDLQGRYATDVFTEEAVRAIRYHDRSRPLFMYLSQLAVHAGNKGKLLEAPQEEIDKFRHIADPNRRTYAAMVAKLDQSVGKVVAALQSSGMLDNTIILFMSDNGAPTIDSQYPNWGSNAPHRGLKFTLWEGGVKGAALVWSPLLNRAPRVSHELMHISDWLPTLYSAAGGRPLDLPLDLDGVDQWPSLANDLPSRRSEIPLNIDERLRTAALRQNNWKLVIGTVHDGEFDGYFGSAGSPTDPPYNYSAVLASPAGRALASLAALTGWPPSREYAMAGLRARATVQCSGFGAPCDPSPGADKRCLYDVQRDPCERNNLADVYPSVAAALHRALVRYRGRLVPQPNTPQEPALADPKRFGGAWLPWHVGLLGLQAAPDQDRPAGPAAKPGKGEKPSPAPGKGGSKPSKPAPASAPPPPAAQAQDDDVAADTEGESEAQVTDLLTPAP